MPHASSPQGRQLGDFRIVREIGRGGMGVVYEAVDGRRGRRVALKVLEAHLTLQRSAVDRFLREAHAATTLRHAHIVPVESVGEEAGVHFFAMELVEGASLADVIAGLAARAADPAAADAPAIAPATAPAHAPALVAPYRVEPFRAAARTIAAIARALHHAHRRGVLHRDVKPSNILLRRDGTPLLIDFGLARLAEEEGLPALTQSGDIVGSPYYVAPEQCGGGHAQLDRRVDVYALGVVLYELVTLQRPFEGASAHEVLEKIASGAVVPPRQLRADLPRELEAIVRRAMALAPGDRYATAADLARDLERFVAGRPIHARDGEWRRLGAALLRSRARLAMAAGGAVVLAGALLLARHCAPEDLTASASASAELTLETEQVGAIAEIFPGPLATGTPQLRVTLPQQAPLRLAAGRRAVRVRAAGHDARLLEGARALDLAPGESVRVSVWLAPFASRWTRELGPLAAPPLAIVPDRDGRRELLVAKPDGELVLVDGDGAPRPFATLGAEPHLVAIAPGSASGEARVAVAAASGPRAFVRLFDGRGAVVLERSVRGRITALLAVPAAQQGAPLRWLAASDLGRVLDLTAAPASDGSAITLAELRAPVIRLSGGVDGAGSCAALTRAGVELLGADGGVRALAGGDGPFSVNAQLFVLRAPASTTLVAVDVDQVRFIASGGDGRPPVALPLESRHAVVVPDPAGESIAITAGDGRMRRFTADGDEVASCEVGESEAIALLRAADGRATIVVAAGRALVGVGTDGARRFDGAAEARVRGLTATDRDGDGVDELLVELDGGPLALFSAEPSVLWKSAADVGAFVVVPPRALGPARLLAQEQGGVVVAFAADGRRLAQLRLADPIEAFAADPATAAVWIGGGDGGVRALRWGERGLDLSASSNPSAHSVTALAIGAIGVDASLRVVSGDAGGGITSRLADGHAELRSTPRTGASVRQLVVGSIGRDARVQAVAALAGGVLARFGAEMKPHPQIELGGECSSLAIADLDGDGATELLVAVEGGAVVVFDGQGARRGGLTLPTTVTALRGREPSWNGGGGVLAGTAGGELYLLGAPETAPRRLATLPGAVVEVAASGAPAGATGDGDPVGVDRERWAAACATRVVAVAADGTLLADVPARGGAGRLALTDLDGDGAVELVHVDEHGRLVVRDLARGTPR